MTHTEATARCWAEINLDALCANYQKALELANGAEVICVLKANAYGLGAPMVCRALMQSGARTFAVATGSEAEELLDSAPGADVLILGQTGSEQSKRLIQKRAIFTLFSAEQGRMLIQTAESLNIPARVHIKADTGLYRLGFSGPDAADQIAELHRSGRLQMEGLFTHLALHDRESDERQFAAFDALRGELAERGIRIPMTHVLDSIGMVRYPEHKYDAVRTGAWLYGVCPMRYAHPEYCRPTVRLMARVAQIHDVPAGERIGYDDDHYLARDTRVATLTAGYADGYPRMDNTGRVRIRGKAAPVLGLVCMDQMMVDVTDIPDAAPGDEVTLLGDAITIEQYAAWGKFNRNEALARIGRRAVRIYHQGGREFYAENGKAGDNP